MILKADFTPVLGKKCSTNIANNWGKNFTAEEIEELGELKRMGLSKAQAFAAGAWRAYHHGNMTDEQKLFTEGKIEDLAKQDVKQRPKPGVPTMLGI